MLGFFKFYFLKTEINWKKGFRATWSLHHVFAYTAVQVDVKADVNDFLLNNWIEWVMHCFIE